MIKKQILLVEGDVTHAERLKQNLEAENYNVDIVHKGNEAILTLKQKWVDFIISSITLQGGMNGVQLVQELKEHKDFNKIPVIIQTSKINMKEALESLGIKFFLPKPYKINELKNQLKEIFNNSNRF